MLVGSFSLRASQVVVNRTYASMVSVGPSDPGPTLYEHQTSKGSTENSLFDIVGSGAMKQPFAGVLVKPAVGAIASVDIQDVSSLMVGPGQAETWVVGRRDSAAINATFPGAHPMDRFHTVTPGQPWGKAGSSLRLTVAGDFVASLWGATLSLTDGSGNERTYRSGRWSENETGASRDQYEQLLELRVTNGTLEWTHEQGNAQWVGPAAQAQTRGAVVFASASGILQSATHVYDLRGESVRLVGTVSQRLEPASDARQLVSVIQESRADVNAGAVLPNPADRDGFGALATYSLLFVVLVLVVAALLHPRARAAMNWQREIDRTANLLNHGEIEAALRRSNRLLRYRPHATEAWLLWGESNLSKFGPGAVTAQLEAAIQIVPRPSPLQFLLAWAYLLLGKRGESLRFLDAALKDERFVRQFQNDPWFSELRAQFEPGAFSKDAANAYV